MAKPVRWAWRHRTAQGKITGLAGRPKIGKGLLYSELIGRISRGELDGDLEPLPGGRPMVVVHKGECGGEIDDRRICTKCGKHLTVREANAIDGPGMKAALESLKVAA